MTHIFLAMQAAIEKTEARKYGQWSIAHVEEKASNLKGIGYSFSGDALRLVRDEAWLASAKRTDALRRSIAKDGAAPTTTEC